MRRPITSINSSKRLTAGDLRSAIEGSCARACACAQMVDMMDRTSAYERIVFSYVGACLLPLALMPVAFSFTMAGHSFMYVVMYSCPVGLLGGLVISDRRQRYGFCRIVGRLFVSLFVFLAFVAVIGFANLFPLLTNKGWLLLPIAGPIVVVSVSQLLFTRLLHV